MMTEIRKCENCNEHLPPETEHVVSDDYGVYCRDCVTIEEYTSYAFYVSGDWIGDTGEGNCILVEDYEDEYEEGEE